VGQLVARCRHGAARDDPRNRGALPGPGGGEDAATGVDYLRLPRDRSRPNPPLWFCGHPHDLVLERARLGKDDPFQELSAAELVRLSATASRALAQVAQVERLAHGMSTENVGRPDVGAISASLAAPATFEFEGPTEVGDPDAVRFCDHVVTTWIRSWRPGRPKHWRLRGF